MRTKKGKCVVRQCKNAITLRTECEENDTNVTYHRFPRDKLRRQKWARALKLVMENITDNHRVCSNHFIENAFDKTLPSRIRLRESAVPFYSDSLPETRNELQAIRKADLANQILQTNKKSFLEESPSSNFDEFNERDFEAEKEELLEAKEKHECYTENRNSTSQAACVSPERIFNSPKKDKIQRYFEEKLRFEKRERKRISNQLRVAQKKICSLKKVIAKLEEERIACEKSDGIGKLNLSLTKRRKSESTFFLPILSVKSPVCNYHLPLYFK